MFKHYRILALAAIIMLLGAVLGAWHVQAQTGSQNQLAALPASAPYQPTGYEAQTSALYENATQSVVHVSVVVDRIGGGNGTGFVIDRQGHIVTNNHVVDDAGYIVVTFIDGTTREAELVGGDPDADLAVIQVDPAGLDVQPVTFADSDDVFIGQDVLAIGSPFGQDFTLTTGIVSAVGRSLRGNNQFSIPGLIQTDAAINPGNSGGPLLDRGGHVIGVNTAILSESGSNSGVGFAVPSNSVRRIVPYLIEFGEFEHSWLGIAGMSLTAEQRAAMNLNSSTRGVLVTDVAEGGPAQAAGLMGATSAISTPLGQLPVDGDVIVGVNNTPITQMDDLIVFLEGQTLPGDQVVLDVVRNGQTVRLSVWLQPRP